MVRVLASTVLADSRREGTEGFERLPLGKTLLTDPE